MPDLPPDHVIAQAVARAANANFERWLARVHAAGCCSQPVRLAGRIINVDTSTGETHLAYTTAGEADRVLYKACGTRRATRCPACAAVYQGDARALILAGLAGGKGTPTDIASHPCVFATLTAPSYGPVHTAAPAVCNPGPAPPCPRGRDSRCGKVHAPGDPAVGTPVCADCYDYAGTVIFNAVATQLWNRTIIGVRRAVAHHLALPARRFGIAYVVSFIKVVEYQRRGAVHLHALIRLDRRDGSQPDIDSAALAGAVHRAATRASMPNRLRPGAAIRWGNQLDVTMVDTTSRTAAAGYIAKYATKSTDDNGVLDRPLRHPDTSHLQLPEHLRRLVETAWQLSAQPQLAHLNLGRWAHTLGYRGHWLTKSRHWSTTFRALRDARHSWQSERHQANQQPRSLGDHETIDVGDWHYKGVGYQNAGDTLLATSAAQNHRLNRRTAWEERA